MFQLEKRHQKYPKYNPTNVDWIGDIPDGWNITPLKWFIVIKSGDYLENEFFDEDGKYPVIGGNGIMGYSNRYNNSENLIAIGRVGAKCGNIHLLDGNNWITDNALQIVRQTGFDIKYLATVLQSKNLNELSNQNAQPLITGTIVKNISIFKPPIEQQQRIASYLDEKMAIIDEGITKKQKQIELLGEHRTVLINTAITKGLDPDVEMKESGIEWIGEIPKGWEVKKLKYWASNNNKKTTFSPDIFSVALENIESWTGKYLSQEGEKIFEGDMNIFKNGDILFGKLRPYLAKVYKTNCNGTCVGEFLVLHPRAILLQDFLYYRLISSDFITQVNNSTFGAKMPRADWDFIGNSKVPVPSLQEQQKIVDYLDKETKYIDDMIAKIEKSIELLQEYKTSLISHVVSGKIKVS